MVTTSKRRDVVEHFKSRGISQRRACELASLHRSTCRYERRREDSPELVTRIKEIAAERPRAGYRMVYAHLRREGHVVNRKRVYRIYKREGLAVRRRSRRKMRAGRPMPLLSLVRANQCWSMDFVHDWLADDRRLRTLNVIDIYTRECLGIEVDTSLTGARVARVLDRLVAKYGVPSAIRVDNGPEFISRALDRWAFEHRVELHFIQPGKPVQNAHVESFNGRFRDECLSQLQRPTLARARVEIETWRVDYNCSRPHSALGYRTPEEFGRIARAALAESLKGLPPPFTAEPSVEENATKFEEQRQRSESKNVWPRIT